MGYTHYWYLQRDFTDEEWNAIIEELTPLVKEHQDVLAGGFGEGDPKCDKEMVWINGKGDDSCETFLLEQQREGKPDYTSQEEYELRGEFHFTKTRGYPYDEFVEEALKRVKRIAPSAIQISSDGNVLGPYNTMIDAKLTK